MPTQTRGPSRGLPDRLQCLGCQKTKTLSYFSQRQLDSARKYLRDGKRPTYTKCIACVEISTTKHEMLCTQCDKVLSSDSFSNRQRKDPENAKCLDCMEVHLLQDAPTKVYDAYKARTEEAAEEPDHFDADDYSDMVTNEWNSRADTESESGVTLPGMGRGQSVGSRNSAVASEFASMFAQTMSFVPSEKSVTNSSLDEDDRATMITSRRAVARRIPQKHDSDSDSDNDENDEDETSSNGTERPPKQITPAATEQVGFKPIDPISQPHQYRQRETASYTEDLLSGSPPPATKENLRQGAAGRRGWIKVPNFSKAPPQASHYPEYEFQSDYSEAIAKQWYPEGDDDSDPENWA